MLLDIIDCLETNTEKEEIDLKIFIKNNNDKFMINLKYLLSMEDFFKFIHEKENINPEIQIHNNNRQKIEAKSRENKKRFS